MSMKRLWNYPIWGYPVCGWGIFVAWLGAICWDIGWVNFLAHFGIRALLIGSVFLGTWVCGKVRKK